MANPKTLTVLITGAAGCLGRALALALALAPMQVTLILHARNQADLLKLDDEIQNIKSTHTVLWPADFNQLTAENLEQTLAELYQTTNSIHFMFNCANKIGQQTPILQEPQSVWNEVLHINVTASRLIIKTFLPLLNAAPASRIVFFDTPTTDIKLYQGAFGMSKTMIGHFIEQFNREIEQIETTRAQIMLVKPLYSALRAKTYPGEDPRANANPNDEAQRIISQLGIVY